MTHATIRSAILACYPKLAEFVQRRFPTDPEGENAFSYFLELYVSSIPNFSAVDGWRMLRIVHETATSLRAVGIVYVLPASELPLEVELSSESGSIRYWVRIGIDDARWDSLSDAKRWSAVYLYASGERDEQWTWSEPVSAGVAVA
jgi:hypothetical protein